MTLEASSQEQEDEELSSEGNANTNKEDGELGATEKRDKTTAVLLSEEELADLLQKGTEEEEEMEEGEMEEEELEADKRKEEAEREEKKEFVEDEGRAADEEEMEKESVKDQVDEEVEKISLKDQIREDKMSLLEDTGSTEAEIPASLDYAADSGILQPLQTVSAKIKSHMDDTEHLINTDVSELKERNGEIELPTIADDYEQDVQNTEAAESEEVSDQDKTGDDKNDKESQAKPKEKNQDVDPQEPKSSTELESQSQVPGRQEEKSKNDSGTNTKGKTRKQKKNQRAKNNSPQREETQSAQVESQQEPQESDGSNTGNTVHKAKRRRAGKWVNVIDPSCFRVNIQQVFSEKALQISQIWV